MSEDTDDLSVRWFSENDVDSWRELFGETFGVSPGGDYFLWKYAGHPLEFTASTVAENKTGLIGALGAIPKKFKIGAGIYTGTHELDMMVKKGQRNLGIFFKLFKFRLSTPPRKEVSLSFGLNDKVLRAFGERFLGYRDVETIPQFLRVLDTGFYLDQRFGDRITGKLLRLPVFLVFLFCDLFAKARNALTRLRVRTRSTDRFDARFDELWEEISREVDIAVVRDSAYLSWRYKDNPACDSEIRIAEDRQGKLLGAIVFTALPPPIETGVILELIQRPGAGDVSYLLVSEVLNELKSRGVKAAALWAFHHQENARVVRRLLFREREQDLFLQVRSLSEGLEPDHLTERSNWYISMGDNDFYYGCPI